MTATAISVQITATRGSAPRDAGTVMQVTAEAIRGTIGGGALEHAAIATARDLLRHPRPDPLYRTIPLGPDLGQCCGGAVTLRFSEADLGLPPAPDLPPLVAPQNRRPVPLWVWGAGHVGRATVAAAAPLGAFDIVWIDRDAARYPPEVPQGVAVTPARDMPRMARHAPPGAHHLILTYSHDIDFALCAALLTRGFASCGLIGSATKRARFARRLAALALDPAAITCPIGDKRLGKHPDAIAQSTLRALLAWEPRQ